jgi:hypothetical protein
MTTTTVCPNWCTTVHNGSNDDAHRSADLATISASPNDGAAVHLRYTQWDGDKAEVEWHIDNREGMTNGVTFTSDGARRAAAELSRLADQLS